jgi:hypothetical protein
MLSLSLHVVTQALFCLSLHLLVTQTLISLSLHVVTQALFCLSLHLLVTQTLISLSLHVVTQALFCLSLHLVVTQALISLSLHVVTQALISTETIPCLLKKSLAFIGSSRLFTDRPPSLQRLLNTITSFMVFHAETNVMKTPSNTLLKKRSLYSKCMESGLFFKISTIFLNVILRFAFTNNLAQEQESLLCKKVQMILLKKTVSAPPPHPHPHCMGCLKIQAFQASAPQSALTHCVNTSSGTVYR